MNNIKIIVLLFFTTFLYSNTLKIDDTSLKIDLLSHSSIYIDKTNSLTINEIKNKNTIFQKNNKNLLGYGYSPDFTVWVKFTLKNTTNQVVEKLLEYDNTLTTNIVFYDDLHIYRDGLLDINQDRKTINPTFDISLRPLESKTYYLRLSSTITTLIVKLKLWNNKAFYVKEIQHQFALALFLGAMCILVIYNLFIYFFTKDKSYLYYVLYIFGMIVHHLVYVGIAFIYFLEPEWIIYIVKSAPCIVALPIFGLAMFTKHFLNIAEYPRLNTILNFLLILLFISIVVFILTDMFDKYRNVLTVVISIYLIYITIYSAIRKNQQAYFILLGRFIIFLAFIFMFLSSQGIFSIYDYILYFIEIAFVSEAVIFSIALSDKINKLQLEKNNANEKLFLQQQNEKERLEIKVDEKTNDLKVALEEKGLLLKELNHRVKNNMQTIVSLIRLQSDQIEDAKYVDILKTIQNRINAMSHLHEMLYQRDNINHINASEYFLMLIDELQDSFDREIEVKLDISVELKIEQAIYCGIIFNELVTNSFKYAFPEKEGYITVKLHTKGNKIYLIVSDNGIGYDQSIKSNSLGLLLINTLVQKQFKGDITIESTDGVKVEISWYAH
jgi:two-component sensor histidine kinase